MVHILVCRGKGQFEGDPIVDPLIGDIPIAIVRGRNEIDERGSGLQPVDIISTYRLALSTGDLLQLDDNESNSILFGKVVSISHSIRLSIVKTSLRILTPTDIGIA